MMVHAVSAAVLVVAFSTLVASECPAGYPCEACGRCWTDEAQKLSGGCSDPCGAGPAPSPTPPPTPPSPTPAPMPVPGPSPPSPPFGQTVLLIGQTFTNEFDNYVASIGAPAGSSHYAEFWTGTINQGDDGDNQAFLKHIAATYPKAHVELALSFKDNPSLIPYSGCNAVYRALGDVSSGRYDDAVDKIASTIASFPSMTFYLRIGYEVSRFQFSFKTDRGCEGTAPIDFEDPTIIDNSNYVNAYNYVARRIREGHGVTNAKFVYHPVRGFGDVKGLYPGDEYVDLVGFSIFNHDVCETLPDSVNCDPGEKLDSNLAAAVPWAKARGKEIMVCESAFQFPADGESPETFERYLSKLVSFVEDYDVRVWAYINSDWATHGWQSPPWADSRVEAYSGVKDWWQKMLASGRYVQYEDLEAVGHGSAVVI